MGNSMGGSPALIVFSSDNFFSGCVHLVIDKQDTTMNQELYHFIGIGGIGMSALALMLLEKGRLVAGSDRANSAITENLQKMGATIYFGQKKEHILPNTTVIYSTDIAQDNPELVRAKELNCPLLHRSDLLQDLMQPYKTLLVTGTHGKTTTTALLTHVFQVANMQPSFAVGGMMQSIGRNAGYGEGAYFIAEADESDKTFLKYPANAAIVTNIGSDHLSYYGSWQALVDAFKTFVQKVQDPALLFYSADCPECRGLKINGTSYGFTDGSHLQASNFRQNGFSIVYDAFFENKNYKDIHVSLTGMHNALNSLAVFGLSLKLGLDEDAIRQGLTTFCGVKRRLEKKGEIAAAEVFDDYAHHPTEIRATLKALRLAVGSRRIIALYQPHRYSRMKFLLDQFEHAFDDADIAMITDLYTAGEAPVQNISSESIFATIYGHHPSKARFVCREDAVDEIYRCIQPNDVVITLGAGDISKVGAELCQKN